MMKVCFLLSALLVAAVNGMPSKSCVPCLEGDEQCKEIYNGIMACMKDHDVKEEDLKNLHEVKAPSDFTEKQVKFFACSGVAQKLMEGDKCALVAGAVDYIKKSMNDACDRLAKMQEPPKGGDETDDQERKFQMAKSVCESNELKGKVMSFVEDVITAGQKARANASAGSECRETIFAMMTVSKNMADKIMKEMMEK